MQIWYKQNVDNDFLQQQQQQQLLPTHFLEGGLSARENFGTR